MRVAIFSETFLPKWDGVANTLCYLLDHLADRGHSSLMFAPRGVIAHYASTPIVRLSGFDFPLYPGLRLVPPVFDVRRQLADFRPDVVHLVNPVSLGLVGLRAARSLGLPVVMSYHTDLPGYTAHYGVGLLRDVAWAYFRWLHNQADLNLCPSHFTRRELEAQGFERIKVWTHGVDTVRFHPRHRCAEWRNRLTDGHPEALLLLYVGRLAVEKRVDWLGAVLEALPEARLAIVGNGPQRQALERSFLDAPVVFTGYLRGDDLSRAYAAGDIFVFPSANETFGNVVLEAMASGLAVVAPRSGGPVDLVRDGETGYLFESDDQGDMVKRVLECVQDTERMRWMGRMARAFAETQRWDVILDGVIEEYSSLVARHRMVQRGPWSFAPPPVGLGPRQRSFDRPG